MNPLIDHELLKIIKRLSEVEDQTLEPACSEAIMKILKLSKEIKEPN